MKQVHDPAAPAATIDLAVAEAAAAFGDPRVYLERFVATGRHVEVQLLGDGENIVHLGTRDCSVQRRYQKLIEEAPAPALDPALREEMHRATVALGKHLEYRGLGTVEFLVDVDRGTFYFLEMNARIQVEHPVTEAITGLDLVAEQFAVAEGRSLTFGQADVSFTGHAIECRLNAEDWARDFQPSPGTVTDAVWPLDEGIRIDTHLQDGAAVPPYYDSLLAKLIVHGQDRAEALARLRRPARPGGTTTPTSNRCSTCSKGYGRAPPPPNWPWNDPTSDWSCTVTADPTDAVAASLTDRLRTVRGIVFDLDGTVVLGDRRNRGLAPLPGALEATAWLTAQGLPWLTFTNGTTRTPEAYADTLRRIGFDVADTAMLTPATSAVDHFLTVGHRRVLVLGGEGLKEPLRQAGIEVVTPMDAPRKKDAPDAVLVGWYREFTIDDLEAACHAVFGGATLYSSSQSVFFASTDGRTLGTSRAICAMISAVTGVAEHVVGKPSLYALHCASRRLRVTPEELAVVGDDPELEMAMARRGDALAIAVATGIHATDRFTALPPEQSPHITIDGVGRLPDLLTPRT